MSLDDSVPRSAVDLTDEELDRYILTRLGMAGVDLSVLPEDDPTAPADRVRLLAAARAFLRNTVPVISRLESALEGVLPSFYPPHHPWPGAGPSDGR